MKRCLPISFLTVFFLTVINSAWSQSSSKPVYVIVHGAWGGGWAFKKVDSLLTEKGCIVYRPTLTGQGERVHLATQDIGLSTHINDVVNMILYEDISDIILVGHSYGGMVITGVADSLAGRIRKLIYLDAMVPEDGESVFTIQSSGSNRARPAAVDGFIVPAWVPQDKLPPKDVPHPAKTLSEPIVLKNSLRPKISTTYILTVAKGTDAKDDGFAFHAERAKKKGWPVLQLEADHNPQWSAPAALVEMLEKTGK